jgi:signal transduction histidine kinase
VSKMLQMEDLLLRSRRMPWAVWLIALVVLALAIVLTGRPVREGIREQMIQREGEVLQAVLAARFEAVLQDGMEDDPGDPATQLAVLLVISRLEGVLGIRLFDAEGRFVDSFPPTLKEQDVTEPELGLLRSLRSVSRYLARARLADQFYTQVSPDQSPASDVALLSIYVPLYTSSVDRLLGVAEFVVDGAAMTADLASLDDRMLVQGLAILLVAGLLLTLALGWAFRRLHRLHRQLAERTDSLLRANAELALAARTAALGAITSHLVHGLRSPLAGLQNLVTSGARDRTVPAPEDWAQAAASMRRMQNLINEVLQVLREHPVADQYQVSFEELGQLVSARVAAVALGTGVRLEVRCRATGLLENRAANLVMLVLANLLENALQASSPGKRVELVILNQGGATVCRVRDQGTGIPDGVRDKVFSPVVSIKEGGSGLGLAISRQLAQHLGARLELVETSPTGSLFELTIPAACAERSDSASAEESTCDLVGRLNKSCA